MATTFNAPGTSQIISNTFQLRGTVRPIPKAEPVATKNLLLTSVATHLWDGEMVAYDQSDTDRPPLIAKVTAAMLDVAGNTDIPQSAFCQVHWRPGEVDNILNQNIPVFTGEENYDFITRIVNHASLASYVLHAPVKVALFDFTSMSGKPAEMGTGVHAGFAVATYAEEAWGRVISVPDPNGWVGIRRSPVTRRAD